MRRSKLNVIMVLITLAMVVLLPLAAAASEAMTIQGEVNDSFQIVDSNGQIYEIADTAEGNALVENHIGEKAKVTGTIEQDQEVKIITVTTFELLAE